jgi:hypothetical protein
MGFLSKNPYWDGLKINTEVTDQLPFVLSFKQRLALKWHIF